MPDQGSSAIFPDEYHEEQRNEKQNEDNEQKDWRALQHLEGKRRKKKSPELRWSVRELQFFVNVNPNHTQPTMLNSSTHSVIMILYDTVLSCWNPLSGTCKWMVSVALPLEANFTGSQQVALFNALVPSPTQLLSPGSKHATAWEASLHWICSNWFLKDLKS